MNSGDAVGLSQAELVELVVELSQRVEALAAENERLRAEAAKNSGNSSKPSSRDPAAERKRHAGERQAKKARAAGGKKRRPGKQPGTGNTLEMTDTPDEVIDHAPESCCGCGAGMGDAEVVDVARRLVGFIAALVAWLRSLPVLHADDTTDRMGTATGWMHVVSTGLCTLIHASVTRGTEAIVEAGVLIGERCRRARCAHTSLQRRPWMPPQAA